MKKLLFWAVVVGVAIYFVSLQWQSLDDMGGRRFAHLDRNPKELVVGISWPISARGHSMVAGLELARDEINAKHYPGVPPIRLIVRDDKDDWDTARRIAMEFAGNPDMCAVIGYDEDSIGMQASPIFENSRLLHFMVNVNNRAMTMHGYKYIIRTVQPTDQIAKFLTSVSPKGRMGQKYAIVWEDDAYGKDIAYQYRIAQESLNGQLVYQYPYPKGHPDFRLSVNTLKGIQADVIIFSGHDSDTESFLRKAQEVGIKTPILVASDLTQDLVDTVGPFVRKAKFIGLYDVASKTPENLKFVAAFRARYGQVPDTPAVQGYDALHLLVDAIRVTKTLNPLDLAYTLRYRPYWRGANGIYRFDESGDLREKPLFLGRAEDQYFRKMKSVDKEEPFFRWPW